MIHIIFKKTQHFGDKFLRQSFVATNFVSYTFIIATRIRILFKIYQRMFYSSFTSSKAYSSKTTDLIVGKGSILNQGSC